MGRARALMGILPRRGPEAFHAFCCALLSLKRGDLVKVLTNPDTEDVDMGFPEQSKLERGLKRSHPILIGCWSLDSVISLVQNLVV
jgi:hypothetical protein